MLKSWLGLRKPAAPDVGCVGCIEGGVLETQAIRLFESIRLYAGRFRRCALYALSPRAGHAISANARRRLDDLGVHYIDAILNTECTHYGPANRVAAAAYIEQTRRHDILVILDSDTLILREPPTSFTLPPDVDVAVRPVDVKGVSTGGVNDPCDTYWQGLCRLCGVDYHQLPWVESFVDRCRIRANYNAGLLVARGGLGIMGRCADFFFASIRAGLRPRSVADPLRTGAGWVNPEVGQLWGSSQAALALAIWSTTRQIRLLPPTYNYPLHLHPAIDPAVAHANFPNLVHVHYHWLFAADSLRQIHSSSRQDLCPLANGTG